MLVLLAFTFCPMIYNFFDIGANLGTLSIAVALANHHGDLRVVLIRRRHCRGRSLHQVATFGRLQFQLGVQV